MILRLACFIILFAFRVLLEDKQWLWIGGLKVTDTFGLLETGQGVPSKENVPNSRTMFGYCFMPFTQMFYIFGGLAESEYTQRLPTSDIWSYNVTSREWTYIGGDRGSFFVSIDYGYYVDKGNFSAYSWPSSRIAPKILCDDENNKFILYGGYLDISQTSTRILFDDLWEYSADLQQWKWSSGNAPNVAPTQTGIPSGRFDAALVLDTKRYQVVLFGGKQGTSDSGIIVSDTWTYDIHSGQWYELWFDGTAPTGLWYTSSIYIESTDEMFIYGGRNFASDFSLPLSDIWFLNLTGLLWTKLSNVNANNRFGSSISIDNTNNLIYLFGGSDYSGYNGYIAYNGLYVYNISDTTFSLKSSSDDANRLGSFVQKFVPTNNAVPGSRLDASIFYNPFDDSVTIFGGMVTFVSGGQLGADLWRFGEITNYLASLGIVVPLSSTYSTSSSTKKSLLHSTTVFNVQGDQSTFGVSGSNSLVFTLIMVAAGVGVMIVAIGFISFVRFVRRHKLDTATVTLNTPNIRMSGVTSLMGDVVVGGEMTLVTKNQGLSIPAFLEYRNGLDYKILQKLTSGGGGVVYAAEALNPELQKFGKKIVAKIVAQRIDVLNDKEKGSFYQELSIMYMFRNEKYIAKLVGYSTQPVAMFMKLYYIGSLDKVLYSKEFRLNRNLSLTFLRQISKGLFVLHSYDMVHLDLKPQNVLIDKIKGELVACLTDFGISNVLSDKALRVQSFGDNYVVNIRGVTVKYAAPEAFIRYRNRKMDSVHIMKASDIYSDAVMMYELLVRSTPWSRNK